MEDHLVCHGCGLIFPAEDSDWNYAEDDPSAHCPDCCSSDILTYGAYLDELEEYP